MKDSEHVFCTFCRKHSFLCPCWYHGRFVVDCMTIGGGHKHASVDVNFIAHAERLAGGMLIRQKSLVTSEAIQNTGDLNALIVWCVQQDDFNGFVVGKDMSVKIKTVDGASIDLAINDWIRVKDNGKLDRISANSFANNWEIA